MATLKDLYRASTTLTSTDKMPVLFIGHGSPMNGIEDNIFSATWGKLGRELPLPQTVLVISAHWLTRGTAVTAMEKPQTIHDFGGFPQALFDVQYPAPGNPELAKETAALIKKTDVTLDHDWGLDHGTWSIVKRMYPEATIPVVQLSIDYSKGPQYHYELAAELATLRKKGVLIIGSGNMVHNLRMLNWQAPEQGYDWAEEMNICFKNKIQQHDHHALIQYEDLGAGAKLAIPTPDHYYPLLYALGLQDRSDQTNFFNDHLAMGSVSMTSVQIR